MHWPKFPNALLAANLVQVRPVGIAEKRNALTNVVGIGGVVPLVVV